MKTLLVYLALSFAACDPSMPNKTLFRCGVTQFEVPAIISYDRGIIVDCPQNSHITGDKFHYSNINGYEFRPVWRVVCECDAPDGG
jgi:hypothetical protein